MCGDVDILITTSSAKKMTHAQEVKEIQGILPALVDALFKSGFMVERLGADRVAQTGSQTFMGVCRLSPGRLHRRIDLKVYPQSQYGYAVLYFTGSATLNKKMRVQAIKYGYKLSDAGLGKQGRADKDVDPAVSRSMAELMKVSSREPVTEAQIFAGFGMKYLEPSERE